MYKMNCRKMIFLAGSIWLMIGTFLLTLGVRFLVQAIHISSTHFSLLDQLTRLSGGREQSAMVILVFALLIGYIKGRTVLKKAAKKQIQRILALKNPHLLKLYSLPYYGLLLLMFGFGFLLKVLPISLDTRGAIDVAIGSALIHGAFCYYRYLTNKQIEVRK